MKVTVNKLSSLFATICIAISLLVGVAFAQSKPNVLFINVDDMNNDLGAYGHPLVQSPNIDKLAKKGVLFTKAYSQSPLCTPSRSSFMTGLYPDQTGIIAHGSHTRSTPHFRDHIPKVTTMAQMFKEQGYFSGRVGKIYHQGVPNQIGTAGPDDPASWHETVNPIGLDKYVEDKIMAYNERALKKQSFGGVLSFLSIESKDEEHTDGKVATAAIKMLNEHHPDKTGKPFFLGVGFYRPHTPFVAPKKYFDLYPLDKIKPYIAPKKDFYDIPEIALTIRHGESQLTLEQRKHIIQGYYAAISYVDAQIGRVIDALDDAGLADNTIVVFLSDHGYELGQHGLWQKGSLFEGSARTPLIIYAPNRKGNGSPVEFPTELVDLYPTLANLAGLQAPDYIQGVDLTPSLDDTSVAVRTSAYSAILNRLRGKNNNLAYKKIRGHSIRTERYRYTEWGGGLYGAELYDHQNDPEELNNLSEKVHLESTRIQMKWLLDDAIEKAQTRIRSIE
ncbi:sulfatase [Thalassomonas sp. M1454]|uniref:sulfatase n=1 Tax=Thalassomonas sp. M1454 TaxID=2594477 RepID=UPI00117BFFD3|nr:sulfatase [Thalassomonas sp. M1454]TRX54957.1 sulfatase [Thalassomonas sp. M1454]